MNNTISYQSFLKSRFKSYKISSYFFSYDHFFKKYINQKITFVEVGVLSGGSLFMWRDFFGPEARIIGVDLNPGAKKWEAYGFEIFIGNQSDRGFWKRFVEEVGMIDIVLDDGGHTYEQQTTTVECLIKSINDGGIIVVEDTHTSYMSGFGHPKKSFVNYSKNMIDNINRRFCGILSDTAERRVWSIEIVESIVAFKVFAAASQLESVVIDNGGEADDAEDFRHQDNHLIRELQLIRRKYQFLEKIPFFKPVARFVLNKLAERR